MRKNKEGPLHPRAGKTILCAQGPPPLLCSSDSFSFIPLPVPFSCSCSSCCSSSSSSLSREQARRDPPVFATLLAPCPVPAPAPFSTSISIVRTPLASHFFHLFRLPPPCLSSSSFFPICLILSGATEGNDNVRCLCADEVLQEATNQSTRNTTAHKTRGRRQRRNQGKRGWPSNDGAAKTQTKNSWPEGGKKDDGGGREARRACGAERC